MGIECWLFPDAGSNEYSISAEATPTCLFFVSTEQVNPSTEGRGTEKFSAR